MGDVMERPQFTHDYLRFDEYGLAVVLCMACGNPIKSRVEQRSMIDPSVIIREVAKHADYREIPVMLSDGNIAFIMVCDACRNVNIGEEQAALITRQLNTAFDQQLTAEGKSRELIDALIANQTRSVVRRAETSETAKILKGALS